MSIAAPDLGMEFDDNLLVPQLYGERDLHLNHIERQLGVDLVPRGNRLAISGSASAIETAHLVMTILYDRLKHGHEVDIAAIDATLRFAQSERDDKNLSFWREEAGFRTRKRRIAARSGAQAAYIKAMREHELVFGIGPAGTGKTWLAVAQAAQLFERKEVDRIILTRPAVEAGERLGFLPGDLREKVDPYLRPIYDALYDLMDARIVERALQTGEIEIAPLAFMRGRTLTNAAIILDEAQNTTSMQMKMFLTRLGENSRMIVTGDPSQVDLPNGQTSGLAEAARLLEGVDGIAQVKFTSEDVIRHELVARIVAAYEGSPQKPSAAKP